VTVDTPAWVRDAVFYQIFPDRFAASARVPKPGVLEPWDAAPTRHGFKGGDLLGIVEHLDDLADLGITAIYLTPIFQSASNHRYHTYDYFHVDPLLGGDAALRELVDAAHERGMRIVLDGVFNHTGRGFWPFHHIVENGADSPYRDWFHLDPAVRAGERSVTPYPPIEPAPAGTLGYEAWWDLPALPKLDTTQPAVREYLFGVAEHWLRFGIDGWRLDVPQEIADPSFWANFRQRCRAVRPDAYLVGEIWELAPAWVGDEGFDALMDYPLAEAILGYAGGSRLDAAMVASHHQYRRDLHPLDGPAFAGRLQELLTAYDPAVVAVQLNLLGSHDAPRVLSILGEDRAGLRIATLLQCLLPGAPCIYYGDEIGLTGGLDPACRGAMPWDRSRWDEGIRSFVRSVIALRHREPALRHGSTTVVGAAAGAVAIERRGDGARFVLATNAGDGPVDLAIALDGADHATLRPVDLGDGLVESVGVDGGRAQVRLRPRSGALFAVEPVAS
jgi:cyclomaltodextrinase / maltogenic alpha-amylase / neopullulanase